MRPWTQFATSMSAGGLYDRRRWCSFPCNRDVTLSDEARDKMIGEKVRARMSAACAVSRPEQFRWKITWPQTARPRPVLSAQSDGNGCKTVEKRDSSTRLLEGPFLLLQIFSSLPVFFLVRRLPSSGTFHFRSSCAAMWHRCWTFCKIARCARNRDLSVRILGRKSVKSRKSSSASRNPNDQRSPNRRDNS